jgi:uncharacterized protein (DUF362 family)
VQNRAYFGEQDCTALDYVAVTIAGFDLMSVATVRLAQQRGIGPAHLDDMRVFGEHVQQLVLEDFKKRRQLTRFRESLPF